MADVRLRDLNPAEFNYGVNVAGSLGVGTTSPNAKVEIRSDGSDSAGAEIRLQHANNNSTDVVSTVNFANNVGSVAMIQGGTTSGNTNGYISFHTDTGGTSVERMRILSNGHVGMGTGATVLTRLHVRGNSDTSDHDCAIRIVDADGTAGSVIPNIQFWTDSQQIYQIRANDSLGLQFRNASDATVVTFDENGRVGIGETEPSNELHVSGTSTVLQLQSSTSAVYMQLNNSGGNATFLGSNDTNMVFWTNSAEKMRITNDGNVGIGTTSVSSKLHVVGGSIYVIHNTGSPRLLLGDSTSSGHYSEIQHSSSNDQLRLITNSNTRIAINKDGKVGINTTSPEETLHVNGNLKVTGTVDVGSSGFSVSSGFILSFGGGTAPSGWLECNGQAVSRSTYSDLFAIVGTIYGAGDGSTTFNVPDLQGRVIMGEGGNTVGRTPADLESVGDTGGSQTATLVVDNLPSHSHQTFAPGSAILGLGPFSGRCTAGQSNRVQLDRGGYSGRGCRSGGGSFFSVASVTNNTGTAGAGTAHNNIQPSTVIMYLIKT